jgi:hypothetical protein
MTLTFDWFLPTSGDGRAGRGPLRRTEYTGRTVREHYGIPRPESQFTAAGPEARADVA